MISIN
jgi:hypothetical protein